MQNEKPPRKQHNGKKDVFEEHVGKQHIDEQTNKQHYAKKNRSDEYIEDQQEEEENPWHVRGNVVEGYVDESVDEDQEEEEEENPWHVRGNVVEGYVDEGQKEEDEDNPWRVKRNIVEGYIEKQQGEEYDEDQQDEDNTDKQIYAKNRLNRVYAEDEQDDGQSEMSSEVADEQSQLASHFNYTRQLRHQQEEEQEEVEGVVLPEDEPSQRSSHVSFVGRLWNRYKESVISKNQQSQQSQQTSPSQPSFIERFWNHYKRSIRPAKGQSRQNSQVGFAEQFWNQYKEFVAAACFLSILPFSGKVQSLFDSEEEKPQLVIGLAYFPLVGLVMALIACLLLIVGPAVRLPSLVIAALVTVALVWLTGGLHLDGLMDTCDGLFDGGTRERKLEIMHDSRSGAFGVLGGICILLLKFALFASLDLHHLAIALLIVLPLARWAMVLAMSIFPNALLTGLGAAARQTVTPLRILIAAVTSLLIALVVGQLIGLAVWIVSSLVALIIGIWVTYILNGLTGDIYGAIAELTEVVCLLVLVGMR